MTLIQRIKSWFSNPEQLPKDYIKNNFTTIRTDDGFNIHFRKYPLFNGSASTAEGMDRSSFKWQEFDEKGRWENKYNPDYNHFENIEILMEIERIRKEDLKIKLEQGEITFKQYIDELPVQDQRIIEYYLAQRK